MRVRAGEIMRLEWLCRLKIANIRNHIQARGVATDHEKGEIELYQRLADNLNDLKKRMRKEQKSASIILDTE